METPAGTIIPARGPYPDVHLFPVGHALWANKLEFTPVTQYTLAQDWGSAKMYASYATLAHMVAILRANHGHHLYEVMRGAPATFVHLDVDRHDVAFTPEAVVAAVLCAVTGFLRDSQASDEDGRALEGTPLEIGVTVQASDSTVIAPAKTSLHLRFDLGMRSHIEHARWTRGLMAWIMDRADEFPELIEVDGSCVIDDSIYNPNRNMRCLYQTKIGKDNPLLPFGASSSAEEDHLITIRAVGPARYVVVPAAPCIKNAPSDIKAPKRRQEGKPREPAGTMVDASALRKFSDHFNSIGPLRELMTSAVDVERIVDLGGVTAYNLRAAVCPYAKRVHKSNHVYLTMRQGDPDVTVCCHDPDCKKAYGGLPIKVCFDYEYDMALHDSWRQESMHPQEGFVQWDEDYDEPSMRPYPERRLVCVRANMGVGKTKALKEFVNRNVTADTKVLVVTFSRTLAAKLFRDFDDGTWTDYSTVKGEIRTRRVVVCLDSMYRVETRNFDYVIIDEALSVFLHFNSPLMQRSSQNCTYLELLVRQSRCSFFVDACIDQTITTQVVHYFSRVMCAPVYWIRNRYINRSDRTCNIKVQRGGKVGAISETSLMAETIGKVIELLDAGKRVVVCSSTKRFTTTLEEYMLEKRPASSMVVCNGDRVNSLDNVRAAWKRDLLVYSPSVSAGVSFEEDHFDSLVGYLVNSHFTPSVDIALQQLYRVRRLRDGDMHLYVHDAVMNSGSLPTTDSQVEAMLDGSMSLVNKYYLNKQLALMAHQVIDDDRVRFDKTRLSYLVIKGIIAMRHRSLKNFVGLLCGALSGDYEVRCRIVDTMCQELDVEVDALLCASRTTKKVLFQDVRNISLEADGAQEYDLLRDSMRAGERLADEDVATAKLYEAVNHRLMCNPAKVDEAFYKTFVADGSEDFYKARRFATMMTSTILEVRADMSAHLQRIMRLHDTDSNLDLYKAKVTAEYGTLIVGAQWLQLCLTDAQREELLALKTVTVHADVMDRTYRELKAAMQGYELAQMFQLFDLKSEASDYIAFRKVMGQAFRLDVCRQHAKSDRKAFKLIDVKPAWLKDIRDTYDCELLQLEDKETCDPKDA